MLTVISNERCRLFTQFSFEIFANMFKECLEIATGGCHEAMLTRFVRKYLHM